MERTYFSLFMVVVLAGLLVSSLPAAELDYSTYLGGSATDDGFAIVVDSSSRAVLTGRTFSADFPLLDPYQSSPGGGDIDVFICRLTSSGSSLDYCTYLGGTGSDAGKSLTLGSGAEVCLTGYTNSDNFPTENPYQAARAGGFDGFVAGLSSSGGFLIYSTYLGGSGNDYGEGVQLDSSGGIMVTGETNSPGFPTLNSYQALLAGDYDLFLCRFSSSGSSLSFSTYFGGGGGDYAESLVLDSSGYVLVTGETDSYNFPTFNSYQAGPGGGDDAFVFSLNPSSSLLKFSTYLGGMGADYGSGIALDPAGRILLTGTTESSNFPLRNPYQSSSGGGESDLFVACLATSGSALSFSTYLGGSGADFGEGIAVAAAGWPAITGFTSSTDFPLRRPYQSAYGEGASDLVTCCFSASGSSLIFSSYLGGDKADYGEGIVLDSEDRIYLTGTTFSGDFPVRNPYQAAKAGDGDILISRLIFNPSSASPWIYDYNGDGISDIAVFRGDSGLWAIRGITRVYFGSSSDELVPGDYDGDGTTDLGIFRPASGLWAVRSVTRAYFGGGNDRPQPGDYDGDGTWNFGVFRDSSGLWAIRGVTRAYFGRMDDEAIAGYYDGDQAKDIALFRPSTGLWALRSISRIYFGGSTDELVPGDYTGAGYWVPSIFRPASGLWAARGVTRIYFGSSSDQPVPADYSGAGRDDFGIFRESSGLWAVSGVTRVYFGTSGDIPVTR